MGSHSICKMLDYSWYSKIFKKRFWKYWGIDLYIYIYLFERGIELMTKKSQPYFCCIIAMQSESRVSHNMGADNAVTVRTINDPYP